MNQMNKSFPDGRGHRQGRDSDPDEADRETDTQARAPDHQAPETETRKSGTSETASAKETGDDADAPPRRNLRRRKLIFAGVGVVILLGAAVYGYDYWTVGRFMISTDDAYVDADSVMVSPRIGGHIAGIAVQDNQRVAKGQVLARIDDSDLKNARASAEATLDAARANAAALAAQIGQQKTAVTQAEATVKVDRAQLDYARIENERYAKLSQKGAGSVQSAQQAQTDLAARQATLARDTAAVEGARQQVTILQSKLSAENAQVKQLSSAADQARLNLGYAQITAPFAGTVGNLTGRMGQNVTAGTPIMVLVPLNRTYISANYKETQLGDVRPGQDVAISVDMFPGKTVHGKVESIAPASGQKFSLLPADNATGNFTKVVQRIPVRISIDPNDPLAGRLRPGMSVVPVIDTRTGGQDGQAEG